MTKKSNDAIVLLKTQIRKLCDKHLWAAGEKSCDTKNVMLVFFYRSNQAQFSFAPKPLVAVGTCMHYEGSKTWGEIKFLSADILQREIHHQPKAIFCIECVWVVYNGRILMLRKMRGIKRLGLYPSQLENNGRKWTPGTLGGQIGLLSVQRDGRNKNREQIIYKQQSLWAGHAIAWQRREMGLFLTFLGQTISFDLLITYYS